MTILLGNTLFTTFITCLAYLFGWKIFKKFNRKSWLNPLFTVSLFLICSLPLIHFEYRSYQEGINIFSYLMQTAIVSLAIPLFRQWKFLRKNAKKIIVAIAFGSAAGIVSTIILAVFLGVKKQIIASLVPKSATLPIALSVSDKLGGETSLTVLFVLSSALFSFICGPMVLQRFKITSKAAKGLAMGASAQALGASKCMQWGEEEGAMGSVGMSITAIFISMFIPILMLIIKA